MHLVGRAASSVYYELGGVRVFGHFVVLFGLSLTIAWPALLIGGLTVTAAAVLHRDEDGLLPARLLVPLLLPIVVLLFPSIAFGQREMTPSWHDYVHGGVAALTIIVSLWLGWQIRHRPHAWLWIPAWLAGATSVAVAWFVGMMALSGDWL